MANNRATFQFLGTGTSTGVPIAGCGCHVCHSSDSRNQRYRSSAWIRQGRRSLIIDTGPEFRLQCIRAGIRQVQAVLLTHDHADHLHGLDDIRAYSLFKRTVVPIHASADTLDTVRHRFNYIWNPTQVGGGVPDITLHAIDGPFTAAGFAVTPIPIMHGKLSILGYRVGDLAYMTDLSVLPESSLPLLSDLGTMVISCVRMRRHPTHLSIHEAIRLHRAIRPRRTFLTHLTHRYSHEEWQARFPEGMTVAHDGMEVEIQAR